MSAAPTTAPVTQPKVNARVAVVCVCVCKGECGEGYIGGTRLRCHDVIETTAKIFRTGNIV